MKNPSYPISRRSVLTAAGLGLMSLATSPVASLAEEASADTTDATIAADESLALSETEQATVGAVNEQGEFTYIPDEHLTDDDTFGDVPEPQSSTPVITEIKGATRYETAAAEATSAFASCSNVLIASGESYADSIAAAGLAGALNCPILLVGINDIPSATSEALSKLGVKNAYILGGESAVSASVASQLAGRVSTVTRIAGATRYDTQMEIYQYGVNKGLWSGNTAYVATGENFADALAASPLCFASKAPVFFVDATGGLPQAQLSALKGRSSLKNFVVLGGEACISAATYSALSALSKSRGGTTTRLSGATRYETSAAIGSYAVKNLGFSWNGVAFTSGAVPYDALVGGPMQGRKKSPLLLADVGSTSSASAAKGGVTNAVTFIGGYAAISIVARYNVCKQLGFTWYSNDARVTSYDVSIGQMAYLEEVKNKGYQNLSANDFAPLLDPNNFTFGDADYLQFAVLNNGTSDLSAAALNSFIAANCSYSEKSYGRTSALRNAGQAIVNAANQTGLNKVYLMAHAIWESGWGCSQLACGWTPSVNTSFVSGGTTYVARKGTTYYNFYGIGAYDQNALAGGRAMAVKQGWTSVEKALVGAAQWIKSNYHARSGKNQNTLYLMRYDLPDAAAGNPWHQYCTDTKWVANIARIMANCYATVGYNVAAIPVSYNVPGYKA